MNQYTKAYHDACSFLVGFGAHGGTAEQRRWARSRIAQALVDLRRAHGRERAQSERRHMLFITGMFPVK